MATYHLNADDFVIEQYHQGRPFASFLPGIAGTRGIPLWAFYVNRGQAMAGFGIQDKDHPIMEFLPANRAYRTVPLQGFRTFIKLLTRRGETFYEPFQPLPRTNGAKGSAAPVQRMRIRMHDLALEELHPALQLDVHVHYFTIPNEPFAALARVLTIRNRSRVERRLDVVDGLPMMVPYGMSDRFLKQMSRTLEAWVAVDNLDRRAPFYRLRVEPHDRAEVVPIQKGHFYVGFVSARGAVQPLAPIVDPALVFGLREDFSSPEAFLARGFHVPARQRPSEKTPCAMGFARMVLPPQQACQIVSLYGHAESLEQLNRRLAALRDPEFIARKARDNRALIQGLTEPMATTSRFRSFDAYCRQTFLDNVLRGGMPVTLNASSKAGQRKVFYIYARKHGDLERDYNYFVLPATYYSQGNANYRDVNQNRRSDVWFYPQIGDRNIVAFFNLIQLDGFNPLVVTGTRYVATDQRAVPAAARELLSKPFTPGELLLHLERRRIKLTEPPAAFLARILDTAREIDEAEHSEGFWTDHWTYNLDLVESYLALYPERLRELLLERRVFTFYDNPYIVVPRAQRYRLVHNAVRQLHAVQRDAEKAALIQSRHEAPHIVRADFGKGSIYATTLIVKVLAIIVNKLASLDPYGMGIEMEADKPNWSDALNGLPALMGSSLCETFELKRWIVWLLAALDHLRWSPTSRARGTGNSAPMGATSRPPIGCCTTMPPTAEGRGAMAGLKDAAALMLPEELWGFLTELPELLHADTQTYWARSAEAKERFRARVRLGLSGKERGLAVSEARTFLTKALAKVERGIHRAYDGAQGLYHTYWYYEVTAYDTGGGEPPVITPTRWAQRVLPPFLQGAVHALRVETDPRRAKALHRAVRRSQLYDRKLRMYRVCASLEQAPETIGRCRVFSPGWLEHQSIWLHMEYKYLLELLRAGLAEEFARELLNTLIPFQPPQRYGRSILENSSFLVSSVYADPRLHGAGFVARLSGATAEFLQMWLWMTAGRRPFFLDDQGQLHLRLAPILPKELFDASGRFTFRFLGQTTVTYLNPTKRSTFGAGGVGPRTIRLHPRQGQPVVLNGEVIPPPYAEMVRQGRMARIDVELAPITRR
ncbi:MAG: hypothetical protein Q8R91_08890 [Candidatus Omnitrophota bacterium]|nr:hypothetical protein [Candidatus Omnitrophota bacterium]